ncbi:hypothetical protein [Intestinibacter sp.]
MSDNIIYNLKIAMICIILVSLMQLFFPANTKVYSCSSIGIGLYVLRKIRKYENENK